MAYDAYILDDDGNPVLESDPIKWADWMKTADRKIAREQIGEFTYVSTVFLGIDHGLDSEGRPLLYETMIFGRPDDEEYCERYATKEEALRGHRRGIAEADKEMLADRD